MIELNQLPKCFSRSLTSEITVKNFHRTWGTWISFVTLLDAKTERISVVIKIKCCWWTYNSIWEAWSGALALSSKCDNATEQPREGSRLGKKWKKSFPHFFLLYWKWSSKSKSQRCQRASILLENTDLCHQKWVLSACLSVGSLLKINLFLFLTSFCLNCHAEVYAHLWSSSSNETWKSFLSTETLKIHQCV